jgi:hypothetical protein
MLVHQKRSKGLLGSLLLLIGLNATPAFADQANSNFGTLKLSPGFPRAAGIARGFTGGSYSFSTIANSDRDGKRCLGFGDTLPDHLLVLEKDFSQLQLKVQTGGKDTTILVKGPDGTIRCGDDTGKSKDASIQGSKWSAGTHKVWIGTFDPGVRLRYTLSVEP